MSLSDDHPFQADVLWLEPNSDQFQPLFTSVCPNCHQAILTLLPGGGRGTAEYTLWPLHRTRSVPPEVPEPIATLYHEATAVLASSPRASAALSRRCLESVLSDPNAGNAQQHNLSTKIDHVLPTLPPYLATQVDAVRQIGNFAAHEIKSTTSGAIIAVEPGEADWNLDILDALFDFYYVQPAIIKNRRAAIDAKLAEAGRKPLK